MGVMLVREPGIRIRGVDGEIAVLPQAPDDVAIAGAVGVVDFDDPVLAAHRNEQIGVNRRPCDGIRVEPVDVALAIPVVQSRSPVHIEMVETVPGPGHLEVLVQDNHHVAYEHGRRSIDVNRSIHIGENGGFPIR